MLRTVSLRRVSRFPVHPATATQCRAPNETPWLGLPPWRKQNQSTRRSYSDYAVKRPEFLKKLKASTENDGATTAKRIGSIEEFEELVELGKADIPTARLFLENSMEHISKQPFEKQREVAAKVGAGKLLAWLWRYREEDTRNADLDRGFSDALCWHLTAEGKENFIWEWLALHANDAVKPRTPETRWNGRLLSGMVSALLYWDRSADAAISLCVRATQKLNRSVHLVQAYTAMSQSIQQQQALRCSPEAFDAFIECLKCVHTGVYLEADRAKLVLYHPTHADATLMLQYSRRRHKFPQLYPEIRSVGAQKHYAGAMGRAAYILRLQGHTKEAEWLDSEIQRLYSGTFAAENFSTWACIQGRNDPKLQSLFNSSPHAEEVSDLIKRHALSTKSTLRESQSQGRDGHERRQNTSQITLRPTQYKDIDLE